ncbi:MAG: hypothetical protein AB8B82_15940 [Roseovarius sp.]
MRFACLAAVLSLMPLSAFAQQGCFGAGQPLFHCTVKGGAKSLDICLQGTAAYYRFGPTSGSAELILAHHVRDIHLTPWNGVGSSIYEELEFWAGDVTYQVHFAQARIASETPELRGGVAVFKADQMLAELQCDAGSVQSRDFYALFEAKERAGQCYDHASFSWGAC